MCLGMTLKLYVIYTLEKYLIGDESLFRTKYSRMEQVKFVEDSL